MIYKTVILAILLTWGSLAYQKAHALPYNFFPGKPTVSKLKLMNSARARYLTSVRRLKKKYPKHAPAGIMISRITASRGCGGKIIHGGADDGKINLTWYSASMIPNFLTVTDRLVDIEKCWRYATVPKVVYGGLTGYKVTLGPKGYKFKKDPKHRKKKKKLSAKRLIKNTCKFAANYVPRPLRRFKRLCKKIK